MFLTGEFELEPSTGISTISVYFIERVQSKPCDLFSSYTQSPIKLIQDVGADFMKRVVYCRLPLETRTATIFSRQDDVYARSKIKNTGC